MDTRSGRTGLPDQYRVSTSPNQRTQYSQQIPNNHLKRSIDYTKVTSIDKSQILAEVQNQNAELRSVRANLFKEAEIGFEKISHLLKSQNAQQDNYQGRRFNSQDKYQNHENDARYEQIRNSNISPNSRFRPHLNDIKPGDSEQITPINSSKILANINTYSRQSDINQTLQPITKKINLAYTSDEFNSNLGIQQDGSKTHGISPSSRFAARDRLNTQDEEMRNRKNKNQDQLVQHYDPKQGSAISGQVQKGEMQSKSGLETNGFRMVESQILERAKNINTSNLHSNQLEVPQKSDYALSRQMQGNASQKYLTKYTEDDVSMTEGMIRTTCDSNSKFSGGISKISLDSNKQYSNYARAQNDLNNLMSRDQNKLKNGYSSPVDTSIISGNSDWQRIQSNDQNQVQQLMKQNEPDSNDKLRPQNAQMMISNTEYFTLDQRFPGEKERIMDNGPGVEQTHPQGYPHQEAMQINSQLNQNIHKYSASNDYKMCSENIKKQINSREVSSDKQSRLQTEQTSHNIAALENNRIIKDRQPSQSNQLTATSQNISSNNEKSVKRSEFYDQVQKRQKEDANFRENENDFYAQRKRSLEEILQPAEWKGEQEQDTQYNQNLYKKNAQQGRSRRENELEQIASKLLVELRMANKFVSFLEYENKQLFEQNKQFCEQNQQKCMNQTEIFNEQNMKGKQIEKLNDTSFNNQKNYETELNGQEHSFFPAYQEIQQHDSNNFQKYNNQQHPNIYDTELMKMKQDFDNKIKEIDVLKSQSKDNSSNIDNLSRVNNELISQNLILEESILQKDRQIGVLQTSLEKQNESLTEAVNKLELENKTIREMYSSEVRRMKEEELREFQELENKVRETILKKDDCIQKLNDVIADLLQNKTNKTYYF